VIESITAIEPLIARRDPQGIRAAEDRSRRATWRWPRDCTSASWL